jgi:transposase
MRERVRPRKFSREFKEDAVRLLENSDDTVREVASRLGMNHWTLRGWYREAVANKKAKKATPLKETPEERAARLEAENLELRKRVAELETDRAILKKAAAFFARESD